MYNKIFTKILDSSIWLETDTTRIVWLTLIASMDETGFCQYAALGNMAGRARVDLEQCRLAVDRLEAPDPESSDPDNEGRRIERVPGGWLVLNAEKYRAIVTRAVSQEQTRLRVARFRAKKRDVTNSNAHVTQANGSVTPSETDAESEAGGEKKAAVAAPASDSDWLSALTTDPTYEGIDVRREFGKMTAWACTNKKQPTRRRFINWLNRAERPIINTYQPHQPTRVNDVFEPKGWKAWLNAKRPDSPLAAGGEREAQRWQDIDRVSQEYIYKGMKQEPIDK